MDEPAKNIIFPQIVESSAQGEEIYKKSHGSYGVGEQKRRGYDWKVDPSTTVFGRKGKDIAFNGVSKSIADGLSADELSRGPIINKKNV
jgi:hypothetical protein